MCVCLWGEVGGSWLMSATLPLQIPASEIKQTFFPFKKNKNKNCSGLSFPSPGDLPDPGTEPSSLASTALASSFFATVPPVISYETKKAGKV